jgi:hypothetical protein
MICLEDSLDIVPGGESVDAVEMAVVADYVQGVGADGAGRSEQGEAFHFKQMRGCCHHSMEAIGGQLSAVGYQLSAISYQLSAISYQWSAFPLHQIRILSARTFLSKRSGFLVIVLYSIRYRMSTLWSGNGGPVQGRKRES